MVHGGEVGATGMGDNYSYTGERSWADCYFDGIVNGDRSMLDADLIFGCMATYN